MTLSIVNGLVEKLPGFKCFKCCTKNGLRQLEHKSQLQLHQTCLSGKKHGEESSDHFAETETGRDQGAPVLGLVGSHLPKIAALIAWIVDILGAKVGLAETVFWIWSQWSRFSRFETALCRELMNWE